MTSPIRDEKGKFLPGNPYGGSFGGGRPEIYTEEWVETELTELLKWMSKDRNLYFKRFCAERGYPPKRLAEAVEKHPRFSDFYEVIHTIQESKYMEGGLLKKLDPGMCTRALATMKVFDSTTTVVVKSDPVSIAVNESMGTSKSLLPNDNPQQSA